MPADRSNSASAEGPAGTNQKTSGCFLSRSLSLVKPLPTLVLSALIPYAPAVGIVAITVNEEYVMLACRRVICVALTTAMNWPEGEIEPDRRESKEVEKCKGHEKTRQIYCKGRQRVLSL